MRKAFDMPVEEYYRLRDEEGLQHKEIAMMQFVSTSTLSLWKKRAGVVERIKTVENYYRLRNDGFRDFHIAQQWKIAQTSLHIWKLANHIERTYFSAPPKQYSYTVEEYIELRKNGYMDKDIHEKWSMARSRLHHWKLTHNVPAMYFRVRNSK